MTARIVAVLAALLLSASIAQARTLAVYVTGALPGISNYDLSHVFAAGMTAQHMDGWSFAPGTQPQSPDRVVWSITPLPFAGDTTRRVGRTPFHLPDLFGRYRYISVEVRVFLDNQYQTTSFATAEVQGGTSDPKLAALIASLTGPLFAIGLGSGK